MRSYTIIKVLALSFGVVSVVARSLPEQRSEIHARAPGGYGFSNPITKLDNADAKVDAAVSKGTTCEHFHISTPCTDCPCPSLSILIMGTTTQYLYQISTT